MTRNIGTKQTQTRIVSCQEKTAITAVTTTTCATATNSCMPPCWMNTVTVSMSLVTRLTSAPRCSACWCSSDRSCTCRKALVRTSASPRSLEV